MQQTHARTHRHTYTRSVLLRAMSQPNIWTLMSRGDEPGYRPDNPSCCTIKCRTRDRNSHGLSLLLGVALKAVGQFAGDVSGFSQEGGHGHALREVVGRRVHCTPRRGRREQPWSTAFRVHRATWRGRWWKQYTGCTASRARIAAWRDGCPGRRPWGHRSLLLVRGRTLRYSFLRQQRAEIGGTGAGGDSAPRGDREGHGAPAQAVPTGACHRCQLCKAAPSKIVKKSGRLDTIHD